MDILILSASPRDAQSSHSAAYTAAFSEGVSRQGAAAECFFLSDRAQWEAAAAAFFRCDHVVFILPVFCSMVPGTMLAFLEKLETEHRNRISAEKKRNIGFVVHGGLPGNGDLHCTKMYLETLPSMLGGVCAGVLCFSDTMRSEYIRTYRKSELDMLQKAGEFFIRNGCRLPETGCEERGITTAEEMNAYCRLINRFSKHIAMAQGCQAGLDAQPYAEI